MMAGTYTYDDFVKEAADSGMLDQFSSYDLAIAAANPMEFGAAMLTLKKNWNGATDAASRSVIHDQAENLRKNYGYTGGDAGGQYYSAVTSPGAFDTPQGAEAKKVMSAYGADKYTDPNGSDAAYRGAFGDLKNFNYADYLEGDQYKALADRYTQQGQKAMQDTLGQISARTGGLASSYAGTAAQQQYSDYMEALTDAAQTGYQNQFSNYYTMLQAAQGLADTDYSRWQDAGDRQVNYYSMLTDADTEAYGRNNDQNAYVEAVTKDVVTTPQAATPAAGPAAVPDDSGDVAVTKKEAQAILDKYSKNADGNYYLSADDYAALKGYYDSVGGTMPAAIKASGASNQQINSLLHPNSKSPASYGSSYNSAWGRAKTMFDKGEGTSAIMAYLDKFNEKQLTDEGLDKILTMLNLGGYREG